jgi:hypothetical protein
MPQFVSQSEEHYMLKTGYGVCDGKFEGAPLGTRDGIAPDGSLDVDGRTKGRTDRTSDNRGVLIRRAIRCAIHTPNFFSALQHFRMCTVRSLLAACISPHQYLE